jgi:hypothetical protein
MMAADVAQPDDAESNGFHKGAIIILLPPETQDGTIGPKNRQQVPRYFR